MSKYLNRDIDTIFLMLGNECNLSCIYCLQHPLVEHQLARKVNDDVIDFIKDAAESNNGKSLYLQFYGGEPLLYYPAIKEVVTKLGNIDNIQFSVISNSKLLTAEMVDFFNQHNFNYTVSWDGARVLETRGFDALELGSEVRNQLMRLNRLSMSAVISAKNYPKSIVDEFQNIDDEYLAIHGNHIGWNFDLVFDTGINNREILDIDYDRVAQDMLGMSNYFLDVIHNRADKFRFIEFQLISSLINRVRNHYSKTDDRIKSTCCCSNGYSVLNIDLEGNLYPCHNTSESIGSIYDPFWKYLDNVIRGDSTIDRINNRCKDCPVFSLCNGGCKLVSDSVLDDTYCRLKIAYLYPLINLLIDKGEDIIDKEYSL